MPIGGRRISWPQGRRHLLFFLSGSPSALATEHPPDVSTLSGRVKFEPVSASLPGGIRFSRGASACAARPSSFARIPAGLPYGTLSLTGQGGIRDCHVPLKYPDRLGTAFTTGAQHLRQETLELLYLAPYLLVQACQHLWLVPLLTMLTAIHVCSPYDPILAPYRPGAGRVEIPSRFSLLE